MSNDFVIQYDKAVMARRQTEEKEDFQTQSQASLSGSHRIERSDVACYTRHVFENFQMEFVVSNNSTNETLNKDVGGGRYQVGLVEDERKWKVVQYSLYDEVYVGCSCTMFETIGIPCKHALYIY